MPTIKTLANGATYQIEVLESSTGLIRRTRLSSGTSNPAKILRPQSVEEYQDDYVTAVPAGTDPASFMHAWLLRRRYSTSSDVAAASILATQFPATSTEEQEAAAALYAARPI